jgi:hypothetical protein
MSRWVDVKTIRWVMGKRWTLDIWMLCGFGKEYGLAIIRRRRLTRAGEDSHG